MTFPNFKWVHPATCPMCHLCKDPNWDHSVWSRFVRSQWAIFTNSTLHQSRIPQCTIQNRNVCISVLNYAFGTGFGALRDLWKGLFPKSVAITKVDVDELVQERRNSSALAMELRLSCTKPSIYIMTSWTHKRYPITRTHGWTMGCLAWILR